MNGETWRSVKKAVADMSGLAFFLFMLLVLSTAAGYLPDESYPRWH